MRFNKLMILGAALASLSSGAVASSHYDGGCTQMHFAETNQAPDVLKSGLATAVVASPAPATSEVAAKPTTAVNETNIEKLQQVRFEHHETAGAVDCDMDAIED